jgi:hypothetical protein
MSSQFSLVRFSSVALTVRVSVHAPHIPDDAVLGAHRRRHPSGSSVYETFCWVLEDDRYALFKDVALISS